MYPAALEETRSSTLNDPAAFPAHNFRYHADVSIALALVQLLSAEFDGIVVTFPTTRWHLRSIASLAQSLKR